ncbi:MAG: flagellar hook-basal body complex protein [Pelosinus sp.]|nr:flagellar hook-basal body complex protein [Pelosinus sp.]
MPRSMYAGVSGLTNSQTRMDVIGNNISNVNTTGFKAGRANFQDMLNQTLQGASSAQGNRGGTNPMQIGLGMSIASIDTLFTDGSTQSTGVASDLAISGDGFFVVADGAKQYYTRAGNFTFDAAGNYENSAGMKVMGWMADANGVLNASGSTVPIVKPSGQTMPAKQSAKTTVTGNLNSSAKNGEGATTSVDLYDSLGAAHKLTQSYYKVNQSGTGGTGTNTWYCKSDVADITSGSLKNQYTKMVFNTDGSLQSVGTVTPTVTAPSSTQTSTLTGLQLNDLGAGSYPTTQKLTFSENDNSGLPHNFSIDFKNTAANTWTYTVNGSTPAATGTITWTPPVAGPPVVPGSYSGFPASFSYTGSDGTTTNTVNLTYPSPVAPGAGTSVAGTVATAAYTQTATMNNLKLSTSTDTQDLGFTAFDTNGDMHAFQMNYTYSAGSNGAIGTWTCNIKDAASQTSLGTAAVTYSGGTYNFTPTSFNYTDKNGGIQTINLAVTPASAKLPDALAASCNFSDPSTVGISTTESPITFNVAGANSMTVTLDRTKVTQASDTSSSLTPAQDGYAMGTLSGYSFDGRGVMTGTFTNGQKKTLAQVALANFTNPGGLNKVSDTLYEKSNNSGEPSVGTTGTGGRGTISPSSLEMSNVDLAQQFSDMIITERGYQANSKIITTSDEMLQELNNLKR